jgi:hypothetical protein
MCWRYRNDLRILTILYRLPIYKIAHIFQGQLLRETGERLEHDANRSEGIKRQEIKRA